MYSETTKAILIKGKNKKQKPKQNLHSKCSKFPSHVPNLEEFQGLQKGLQHSKRQRHRFTQPELVRWVVLFLSALGIAPAMGTAMAKRSSERGHMTMVSLSFHGSIMKGISMIFGELCSVYIYIHVYHASIFLWITYTVRVSPDMIFQIKSKV